VNREVLELLRDVARGEIGPAISARARALMEPKKSPAPKKRPRELGEAYAHAVARRKREDLEEAEAKATMRADVWTWNLAHTRDAAAPNGRCDCGCGYVFRHADEGECDHWKGRRGPDAHTRGNGWRLAFGCHVHKTLNRPDVATWNAKRKAYCERAGIAFVPRRER
jgi:hypothetical protein